MSAEPIRILRKLNESGFEAYLVGGCVRDRLLGRPIHDWDVTTSALPEQVLRLFPHCVPTGLRHGTVTVLEADEQAEVTTFRADGSYSDSRHPDGVRFVRTLREDLARRDFTVNAMAMDPDGRLYDFFGGQEDLSRKLLRCVGDPQTRFTEDALRMLRGYRFAAQLDFSLEEHTQQAVFVCSAGAARLSRERVREEAEKTLLSPRPEYLERMLDAGLLLACGLEGQASLASLSRLPQQAAVRWAAWKLAMPQLQPQAFRLPSKLCGLIQRTVQAYTASPDALDMKRAAARFGIDAAQNAAILAGKASEFEDILASGDCLNLAQLAVKGSDLPGYKGPELGAALNRLLEHVLEHPEDNDRQTLLALL